MIPEEGGSMIILIPKDNCNNATQISQMGYELKYEEYFGGTVLFTKEQVERTNGYSNDYWEKWKMMTKFWEVVRRLQ